jgi:hypothetical protein
VATWSIARDEVTLKPFAPLAREVRTQLDSQARDVVRYLRSAS